jgi:hypothetical protein
MADLIDQTTLLNMLAAGGFVPTTAQSTVLPQVTAAVSRAIRRYTNRQLTRATYDELYTVGLDGQILLREYPVNAVTRCAINPTTVLTITNTSTANQRALVKLGTTGDADTGLTPANITLASYASGVATTATVSLTTNQTIAALATAINAVGSGWVATADSNYALWPTADLRAVQGNLPAISPAYAEFKIHVDDIPFELVEKAGIVSISANNSSTTNPWRSTRWGPPLSTDYGDQELRGRLQGVRVVYDAGLAIVPEDLQHAAALAVTDWIRLLSLDPRLSSETAGDYSYVVNSAFADYHLPKTVLGMLAPYRNLRL